jgi:hypothetical protein
VIDTKLYQSTAVGAGLASGRPLILGRGNDANLAGTTRRENTRALVTRAPSHIDVINQMNLRAVPIVLCRERALDRFGAFERILLLVPRDFIDTTQTVEGDLDILVDMIRC